MNISRCVSNNASKRKGPKYQACGYPFENLYKNVVEPQSTCTQRLVQKSWWITGVQNTKIFKFIEKKYCIIFFCLKLRFKSHFYLNQNRKYQYLCFGLFSIFSSQAIVVTKRNSFENAFLYHYEFFQLLSLLKFITQELFKKIIQTWHMSFLILLL